MPIYDIELPKLSDEKHKKKTFKLVSVMDMTTGRESHFYRLLFKHVDSSMYIIEELPLELLFKFPTGAYYKNSYMTKDKPDGENKEVLLSGTHYNIGKISDFIEDDEFNFDHKIVNSNGRVIDFSAEIKDQYCIAYKNGGETVILPSYLIGEKFFFISTNMRRRIFDSQPEKLYEKIEYKYGFPIIYLKSGVAFADAPYLVHNHMYKHASESWHAIRNELNREIYARPADAWHIPLKITLPFKNIIKMFVRYNQLPNNKILIHEILDHESFFSFSNIKIVTSGKDEEDAENGRNIPTKNRRKKKRLNQKPPNRHNTFAGIRNKVEEGNLKYQGIEIEHIVENDKDRKSTPTSTENSDESTNVSSLSPISGGDEGTSPLNATKDDETEEKNKKVSNRCTTLFRLEHFKQIFKLLSNTEDVYDPILFTDKLYPWRVGIEKCNLKETYDRECRHRRKWYYFSFLYKNNYIVVIDLDQEGLNNGSSIFVMKSLEPIYESDIAQLLRNYAKGEKLQNMKDTFKAKKITLITKRHKCPNKKDHEKIWGKALLKSIKEL